MYKYSKKAQERFFSVPVFAYLFAWFAHSPEGIKFTQAKFEHKGDEYYNRMKIEIEELKNEAIDWLRNQDLNKTDPKCSVLLAHLA